VNDVDSPEQRELPLEDPAVNSSTAGTSKLHVNGAGEETGSILASVYFSTKSSHTFSEKIFQQITHTCFALLRSHHGH
jgi:predicted secreted protein